MVMAARVTARRKVQMISWGNAARKIDRRLTTAKVDQAAANSKPRF